MVRKISARLWESVTPREVMKKFDVSEVVIREESAEVVSFQPIIEVNLVEVRGYHLFAQFVALRAQERNLQTGEDSDQRLT